MKKQFQRRSRPDKQSPHEKRPFKASRRDDAPRKDPPRREAPRRDAPRRDAPRKEPLHRDPGPAPGVLRLFGHHAVASAWLNPKRAVKRLLLTQHGRELLEPALQKARQQKLNRPEPQTADGGQIEKLLPKGAVHQGLMLEADELPEIFLEDLLADESTPSLLVVLDQVTDPHNVGAILRSASAFGARAVLMTDRHAAGATGTLAKTASGALDVTPLVRIPNLARALADMQKAGYWCIGLDEGGRAALHEMKLPQRLAVVLGAEGQGLRRLTRESCDEIARLPTGGPVGSLNVSNAAAVAIYEARRQLG